ncbi:polyhydroxyalkanoic acid system family protein [Sphingomicrobium nitratireducens]|uniref:polyhydroxyalkanoic acid system family protein n=1 Tax=Sphingomicrobium nitratireducens TaxID=2964666 RepID=UPI0022406775|nr:polyhydroxyalkanoic acid system family protein [Sphingomicrobium nitratireducens]
MQRPIEVDLPHQLGRDEAKRRISGNMHTLSDHIPGGVADVKADWEGDRLKLVVGAMGQEVNALIDVQEKNVHCRIELPGMLALFAGPIEAMLRSRGDDLLLEDRSED